MERGLTEDKETIPVVPGRHWEERQRDPSTLGCCGTGRRGNSEQIDASGVRHCQRAWSQMCVGLELWFWNYGLDQQQQHYLRTY